MSDKAIVSRACLYSEANAVSIVSKRGIQVRRTEKPSHFFFGNYAELRALHIIVHKKDMRHGLSTINKFRSRLLKKIGMSNEELRFQIACSKRISGQHLFLLCEALDVPVLVAYPNYYIQSTTNPKVCLVLHQGGCTITLRPTNDHLAGLRKGRLRS